MHVFTYAHFHESTRAFERGVQLAGNVCTYLTCNVASIITMKRICSLRLRSKTLL